MRPRDLSVADELRKAAELGYSHLELSSRADWFYWQRYPKADDAIIAATRKAVAEAGVVILALLPVFDWSSPREKVRRAQVRNWRRLLPIAHGLECPVVRTSATYLRWSEADPCAHHGLPHRRAWKP